MPLTVLTVAMTILAYIAMSQDVLEEGRSKQRLYVPFHTLSTKAFLTSLASPPLLSLL